MHLVKAEKFLHWLIDQLTERFAASQDILCCMGLINTSDLVMTCISLIFFYFVPLYGTCTSWFYTSLYVHFFLVHFSLLRFVWRYVLWCTKWMSVAVMFRTVILLHILMTSYCVTYCIMCNKWKMLAKFYLFTNWCTSELS